MAGRVEDHVEPDAVGPLVEDRVRVYCLDVNRLESEFLRKRESVVRVLRDARDEHVPTLGVRDLSGEEADRSGAGD